MRVALTGKRSSGLRPCPGPPSGENFLINAVETDSWLSSKMTPRLTAEGAGDAPSPRRAPHSQESSERLQTLTSQEFKNA